MTHGDGMNQHDQLVELVEENGRLRAAIHGLMRTGDEFPCMNCGYTNAHQPDCPWVALWQIERHR